MVSPAHALALAIWSDLRGRSGFDLEVDQETENAIVAGWAKLIEAEVEPNDDHPEIRIVFDGPPGPVAGRFVEVEDAAGHGLKVGKWVDRGDGLWDLRLTPWPAWDGQRIVVNPGGIRSGDLQVLDADGAVVAEVPWRIRPDERWELPIRPQVVLEAIGSDATSHPTIVIDPLKLKGGETFDVGEDRYRIERVAPPTDPRFRPEGDDRAPKPVRPWTPDAPYAMLRAGSPEVKALLAAGWAITDARDGWQHLEPIRVTFATRTEKVCTVPPAGWSCSREPGHEGPCAASPVDERGRRGFVPVTIPPVGWEADLGPAPPDEPRPMEAIQADVDDAREALAEAQERWDEVVAELEQATDPRAGESVVAELERHGALTRSGRPASSSPPRELVEEEAAWAVAVHECRWHSLPGGNERQWFARGYRAKNPTPADQRAIAPATWRDFQRAGLLWWVNRQLHLFGWALVFEGHEGEPPTKVYAARTKFRGFETASEVEGFARLGEYLASEAGELVKVTRS